MTRDEYKVWLSVVSSKENITERKALFVRDRAFAKELQQYEPELARLLERNVENAEEFYAYLKRRMEIN